MNVPITIKKLDPSVPIPAYQTAGAVAFDLSAAEEVVLAPQERRLVPTGLVVCVPEGHVLILAPRSSNAKKGVMFANGIGIIDQDYCGPDDQLFLALYNIGPEPYTVKKGERIGQGLFVPVARAKFEEQERLNAPNRGSFGTTG